MVTDSARSQSQQHHGLFAEDHSDEKRLSSSQGVEKYLETTPNLTYGNSFRGQECEHNRNRLAQNVSCGPVSRWKSDATEVETSHNIDSKYLATPANNERLFHNGCNTMEIDNDNKGSPNLTRTNDVSGKYDGKFEAENDSGFVQTRNEKEFIANLSREYENETQHIQKDSNTNECDVNTMIDARREQDDSFTESHEQQAKSFGEATKQERKFKCKYLSLYRRKAVCL